MTCDVCTKVRAALEDLRRYASGKPTKGGALKRIDAILSLYAEPAPPDDDTELDLERFSWLVAYPGHGTLRLPLKFWLSKVGESIGGAAGVALPSDPTREWIRHVPTRRTMVMIQMHGPSDVLEFKFYSDVSADLSSCKTTFYGLTTPAGWTWRLKSHNKWELVI